MIFVYILIGLAVSFLIVSVVVFFTAFYNGKRKDVLSWVNYVCEKYGKDTPVYLDGVSMGAAPAIISFPLR